MTREDNRDRVARLGTEAWKRLKKTKDYHDWVKVGEALRVGREWALAQCRTNKPEGKAYNMTFGEWLQRYKMDDMDKGERSRLFGMMDALPQVEEWRATLTMTERLKLNHPTAIMRKFKAAFEIPDPDKPAKPGLRDAVAELEEEKIKLIKENERLKDHIKELEASGKTRDDAACAFCGDQNIHDAQKQFYKGELPTVICEDCLDQIDAKRIKKAKPARKARATTEDEQ